jgi:hypothetical protein
MPLLDLLVPTESGRNLSASGGRLTNSYLNFSTKRIGHEGSPQTSVRRRWTSSASGGDSHAVVGRLTNNLIKFPLLCH